MSEWYRDVQKDVRHHDLMSLSPLPVESSSAHVVYTSHTIEHVAHAAVSVLFKEALRVLRPGGVLRVTTAPDAETNFKALLRNDSDWFYWDHMYSKPGTYEHIFEQPAPSAPLEERWLHHFASQLAPNDRSPSPAKVSAKEVRELIDAAWVSGRARGAGLTLSVQPATPGQSHLVVDTRRIIGLMRDAGFSVAIDRAIASPHRRCCARATFSTRPIRRYRSTSKPSNPDAGRSIVTLRGSSLLYIGAAALNALIPFFLLGYVARVLGPVELGRIGLFLVMANVANVLIGLNTHGLISVLYFREGGDVGAAKAIKAASIVLFVSTVIGLTLGWAFGDAAGLAALLPGPALVLAVACASMQFLLLVCLTYLQCAGRPILYGAVSIASSLATACATLLLLGLVPSWTARAAGQLIGGALLALIFMTILVARLDVLKTALPAGTIARAVSYGLPLVPHSLAVVAMSGYDRFFIGDRLSADAAGQYFGASQLASIVGLAATAFNQAWIPWLYSKLQDGTAPAQRLVVRATWTMIVIAGVGALLISLAAAWLIPAFLGPGYDQAITLLPPLVCASAVGGIYFLVANHLFYFEATRALPIVTCACAALQVLLIHLLGPAHGAQGVAWSVLLSQIAFVGGVWWLVQRTCPLPWFRGMQWR